MSVFSCKDTARLASQALDGPLGLGQSLALRIHVLMCPSCARFQKHLAFLRDAARRLEDQGLSGDMEQANLSREARERLQRALQQPGERSSDAGLES